MADSINPSSLGVFNSLWTDELETQIKYLGDCARGYVWMYRQDILKYSRYHQYLSGASIVIGILAGCLGGLSLGFGVDTTKAMVIVSTIFSFGTSVCQGFIQKFEFETKISDLKRQVYKYSGLVNNIRRQLGLPQEYREKAIDYNRWISLNYEELSENSIEITPSVIRDYRELSLKQGIPFPDSISIDSNIVVHKKKTDEEKKTETRLTVCPPESPVPDNKEPPEYTDLHMKYEMARMASH